VCVCVWVWVCVRACVCVWSWSGRGDGGVGGGVFIGNLKICDLYEPSVSESVSQSVGHKSSKNPPPAAMTGADVAPSPLTLQNLTILSCEQLHGDWTGEEEKRAEKWVG
jgi:hypothetical protein